MFSSRNHRFSGCFRFLGPFLIILLLILLPVFYMDRIAAFAVNRFTGYNFSYDRWGRTFFDRSEIDGLYLEARDKGIGVKAETTHLGLMTRRSIERKGLLLECEMEGVSIITEERNALPASSTENILEIPIFTGQKYKQIRFTVFLNRKIVEISGFEAYSKDIRINGDCVFNRSNDDITLDMKIAFSPEIYSSFPEDVRDGALSLDDDGWYGTVISYRGNVIMLRALYSLTVPE